MGFTNCKPHNYRCETYNDAPPDECPYCKIELLEQENARYREALENIVADFEYVKPGMAHGDRGRSYYNTAKQALNPEPEWVEEEVKVYHDPFSKITCDEDAWKNQYHSDSCFTKLTGYRPIQKKPKVRRREEIQIQHAMSVISPNLDTKGAMPRFYAEWEE